MRIKAIYIAVAAPLVAVIVVGVLKIPVAAAQVDATSTPPTADLVSTSTDPSFTDTDATSTAPSDTTSTASSSTTAIESAPQDLTLVHIIGMKYIDYFTDGTNTYTFPATLKSMRTLLKKMRRSRHTRVLHGFIRPASTSMTLRVVILKLLAFDKDSADRRIVYVVFNFDDRLHEYADEYQKQIKAYIAHASMPNVEVVPDIKSPFHSVITRSEQR